MGPYVYYTIRSTGSLRRNEPTDMILQTTTLSSMPIARVTAGLKNEITFATPDSHWWREELLKTEESRCDLDKYI